MTTPDPSSFPSMGMASWCSHLTPDVLAPTVDFKASWHSEGRPIPTFTDLRSFYHYHRCKTDLQDLKEGSEDGDLQREIEVPFCCAFDNPISDQFFNEINCAHNGIIDIRESHTQNGIYSGIAPDQFGDLTGALLETLFKPEGLTRAVDGAGNGRMGSEKRINKFNKEIYQSRVEEHFGGRHGQRNFDEFGGLEA
ncbi:hypothetical protein BD779DRAFT_1476610 [Infundibulicybe gibba]|nr:hypothetical protein BD779DRAFT_1476610 [Infundibulicybe gibba]